VERKLFDFDYMDKVNGPLGVGYVIGEVKAPKNAFVCFFPNSTYGHNNSIAIAAGEILYYGDPTIPSESKHSVRWRISRTLLQGCRIETRECWQIWKSSS
jgi:hypothetical protein